MKLLKSTALWLHGLGAATISGFCQAFLAILGVDGAKYIGIEVTNLSGKQVLITSVIGGLISAAMYLKQSPLPPEDGGTKNAN